MAAAGSTNPPVRQHLRLPDLPKDVVSVSTSSPVSAIHDAVSAVRCWRTRPALPAREQEAHVAEEQQRGDGAIHRRLSR
jgi:hypothetical protein